MFALSRFIWLQYFVKYSNYLNKMQNFVTDTYSKNRAGRKRIPAVAATTSAGFWSCTCPASPPHVRLDTTTRLVRPGRRRRGKRRNLGLQQHPPTTAHSRTEHSNAKRSRPTLGFHDVESDLINT
jgi:hypothetical protein